MTISPTAVIVLGLIGGLAVLVVQVATLEDRDVGRSEVCETPDEDPRERPDIAVQGAGMRPQVYNDDEPEAILGATHCSKGSRRKARKNGQKSGKPNYVARLRRWLL